MSKLMVLVASAIFVTGVTVLAQQRSELDEGPEPGTASPGGRGTMPAYYTNRIMPPGPVDTAEAQRWSNCTSAASTWSSPARTRTAR